MHELQKIIDKPFIRPEFSAVTLQGDELIVTVDGATRSSWLGRGLALSPGIAVLVGSYVSQNFQLFSLGAVMTAMGLGFVIVGAMKTLGSGPQRLRISPRGVSILRDKQGGDFSGRVEETIQLESLEGYFLGQSIQHQPRGLKDHNLNLKKADKSSLYEKTRLPGIYFQIKGGVDKGFAINGLESKGPVNGAYSQRDYVELRWLFSIIKAYLDSLRGVSAAAPKEESVEPELEQASASISDPPDESISLSDTEAW